MALSQALSAGISGLMTHQKAMDNIGNNLANVNTAGFKKGVFQFSTLLEQSLRGGMMADASSGRGSVNPINLGLGTSTYSINKVFTQGQPENTQNPYDMMIDGNGFFVLKQGNGYAYTRAGSFYKGEDGSLLAGKGLYVQGTLAVRNSDGTYSIPDDARLQNITIPIGSTGGHSQTSQVTFLGNLDSRKDMATGTRLFGGTTYPNVSSLQQWMWKDYNGGNPVTDAKVDHSWNSLEKKSYAVARSTLEAFNADAVSLGRDVTVYNDNEVVNFDPSKLTSVVYAAMDSLTGGITEYSQGITIEDLMATPPVSGGTYIPLIEEVKTINGGNVQTSAAYGVKVPENLANGQVVQNNGVSVTVNNTSTLPAWFYQSTGGNFEVAASYDDDYIQNNLDEYMREVWPDGFNGEDGWPSYLPRKDETYSASVNTPLENLRYLQGDVWVQPFANIKNGDEVTVSFVKGKSQMSAAFTYNKPAGPDPISGQQPVNREQSYTLGHFLKFMAGDVDEPTIACQRVTPAMFGAEVTEEFPEGNPNTVDWDRAGYELSLRNVALATQDSNMDNVGGAMGLMSIPPLISDQNYGADPFDAPPESAGAYTRTGQDVYYDRWNPLTNQNERVKSSSFVTSIVSNLGEQNAITDLKITYNNVPHDTLYKKETEYSAAQGGASTVTVDFYDSLGNPKEATLRLAMVSQDDNFTTWRWYADCVDDSDFAWQADPETGEIVSSLNVGTGLIRFDKNGNYVKGAEYSESNGITINQSMQGVNNPIIIQIINSLSGGTAQDLDFSEMTCSAQDASFRYGGQNGYPPGTLTKFTVGLDGVIQGEYDNGNYIPIARIALAIVPNEHGLMAAGNNLFYTSPASGDARISHAGIGGSGSINYMQLETSNVDLSEEFTKLITTERGFQANSRTITTADEMIQELLNLKR